MRNTRAKDLKSWLSRPMSLALRNLGSNEQIKAFCSTKYKVSFPLFSKIVVKGKGIHPLYDFLTGQSTNPKFAGQIPWNFTKFIVNRQGEVIVRVQPSKDFSIDTVASTIEKALAEKGR